MREPEVSIVVPTRDRPALLARCLAALDRQEGLSSLEVVVVDDGSRDAATVAAVVARFPEARLLRLDGRGPAAARNRGVVAARAPFICFSDDDCLPWAHWAARLAGELRDGADAVGGLSVSVDPNAPATRATGVVGRGLRSSEGAHPYRSFAATASLAARADVMHAVPFDEGYRFASEDRDWCARITSAGYTLALRADAIVTHLRSDGVFEFWKRYVRYGEGSHRFRTIHSGGRPAQSGFYLHLLRNGFAEGPSVGALVALSQLATAVGYAHAARRRR